MFRVRRERIPNPESLEQKRSLYIQKLYEAAGEDGASGYGKQYLGIADLKKVIYHEIEEYADPPKHYAYSLTLTTGISIIGTAYCYATGRDLRCSIQGKFRAREGYDAHAQTAVSWRRQLYPDRRFETGIFLKHFNNKQHVNSKGNNINNIRVRLRNPTLSAYLPLSVTHELLGMDGVFGPSIVAGDDAAQGN
ncbi:hypothetical protein LTS10_002854 [Elasticomyces elasticus]|nr:hypothetical protein LTS10_002854 [Elasticomyces elasticus]